MSNHDRFAPGHLLLAFLGGAAAGAAIAYLTAPRSGSELRQDIADSYSTKRGEVARIPPAMRAAYNAATAAARVAYADAIDHKPAA